MSTKEELEKKKARLAELRKAKEARLSNSASSPTPAPPSVSISLAATTATPSPAASSAPSVSLSLGDLLGAAGVAVKAAEPEPPSVPAPPEVKVLLHAPASTTPGPSTAATRGREPPPPEAAPKREPQTQPTREQGAPPIAERMAKLSVSESVICDVSSKPRETYEKVTQTDEVKVVALEQGEGGEADEERGGEGQDGVGSTQDRPAPVIVSSPVRSEGRSGHLEDQGGAESAAGSARRKRDMTEGEVDAVLRSDGFRSFFGRSAKVMERALADRNSLDILKDYTKDAKEGGSDEETQRLFQVLTMRDEVRCKKRPVTSVSYSEVHRELILATMLSGDFESQRAGWGTGGTTAEEGEGLACVWNAQVGEGASPEFVLACQSGVTAGTFHRFSAHEVIGGTQSGQVVVWDLRAGAAPVSRTPLTALSHTHPIVTVQVLGTAGAHSIVSVCRDGRMCAWSPTKLSEPTRSIQLTGASPHHINLPFSVTSVAFPRGEANVDEFVVGGEDGSVMSGSRSVLSSVGEAAGEAAQVGLRAKMQGHSAPVTGLSVHPPSEAPRQDFSQLAVSCSVDSSVRLWDWKSGQPVLFLDLASDESMLDCKWNTELPGVFATSDAAGELKLWDLCESLEGGVASVTAQGEGARGVNCLEWAHDGRHIAAGDAHGGVHLFAARCTASESAWDDLYDVLAGAGVLAGPEGGGGDGE